MGLSRLGDDPDALQPRRRAALAFDLCVAARHRADALHAVDGAGRTSGEGPARPAQRMGAAAHLAGHQGSCAAALPDRRGGGALQYPAEIELYRRDLRGSAADRSEEHTSELQSLMRISYAVFCLKKKRPRYTSHPAKRHTKNTKY